MTSSDSFSRILSKLTKGAFGFSQKTEKSHQKAEVTFVLLNWKRRANLLKIIDSIKAQTVATAIFLWNNGRYYKDSRIDWVVESSKNRFCFPRWFMASMAESPYVATLDDDFFLGDETIIAEAIAYVKTLEDPFQIVGASGAILPPDLNYKQSTMCGLDSPGQLTRDWEVDIIKGQHMLLRRDSLVERLRMVGPLSRGDDIIISGLFAQGRRRFHRCPSLYHRRLLSLPDSHAMHRSPDHYQLRGGLVRKYFN